MRLRISLVLVLFVTLMGVSVASAQDDPEIQEFFALITLDNQNSYFDLFGMQAGQTIYVYAESADFDTEITICDIECEEEFAVNDDLSDTSTNSALEYTFEADGDYSILVWDCCVEDAEGTFRLLVGFNAPEVLTGNAISNGAAIAIPYEDTYIPFDTDVVGADAAQVQEVADFVDENSPIVYYDLYGMVAGQTIYVYAGSEEFDPYVGICDFECNEFFVDNDDLAEDNTNAAVEYTFEADGDYSIAITDYYYLNEDTPPTGQFILQVGYNAPEVLTGEGVPTGAEIAVAYEPDRTPVASVDEDALVASANCAELQERPELSGAEAIRETESFVIHYTPDGADGATESFVGEVAAVLDDILAIQINQFGWPLPPQDCGEGGDARFDLYLQEIMNEGVVGYAVPGGLVGDNPATDRQETWAAYSYLIIDNDFAGVTNPLAVMRATVAHEIHHGIQFSFDINDALNWYYESTASWIETQTYPTQQDATPYVSSLFESTDWCIGSTPDNPDLDTRVYGEWLLIDSIYQDYGNETILRFWEIIGDLEGMDSLYSLASELGTTPQEMMLRFSVRNLLKSYALGDEITEQVRIEGVVNGVGDIAPRMDGVQELGTDYVLVRIKGNYTFSIDQSNLELYVVGINQNQGEAQVFPLGQSGTVDTTPFSYAYVLILNTDQHEDPTLCSAVDWQLSVTDGTGEASAEPLDEIFDATKFDPAG